MTHYVHIKQQLKRSWLALALAGISSLIMTVVAPPAVAAGMLVPAGQTSSLKIAKHKVDVTVEDGYAITRVDQTFSNSSAVDTDAIYSFPVPEEAAVSGFTVWIDGKPMLGEVFEKEQARRIHEEEKQAGRDTGLAEKKGYKTFELSVSPVRANSMTRLSLTYMQPIRLDAGVGRFVYPLEDGGVDEEQASFWDTNDQVEQFSFDMKIRSAVPVDAVRMTDHQAIITQHSAAEWQLTMSSRKTQPTGTAAGDGVEELEESITGGLVHAEDLREGTVGPAHTAAPRSLNKDLVVYWRLAPDLPASVDMTTFKPDAQGRGTFMMVLTPGNELKPIVRGKDWTFVVDMSGSMQGKFETVMQGLTLALDKLQPDDRLRLIAFNKQAWDVSGGFVSASPDAMQRLIQDLRATGPNGGTNLHAGLARATDTVDPDRTSSIVLITDGVANIGNTEKSSFLNLVNDGDIRLFTMIMGNSANRPLLHDLTDASGGFAISVSNADDVVGLLLRAVSKVSHEAMHDIQVTSTGVKMTDIVRSRDSSLYHGDQLILLGHYWGDGSDPLQAQLQIDAQVSGKPRSWTTQFEMPRVSTENPEIERLWAFSSVQKIQRGIDAQGESADLTTAIVDIATQYSIVTDYTSMLVLSEQAMAERGVEQRNAARTKIERAAQQQRAGRPAQSRRVDQAAPTFQGNRASNRSSGGGSGSGGGSVNLLWLLLLGLPLLLDVRQSLSARRDTR